MEAERSGVTKGSLGGKVFKASIRKRLGEEICCRVVEYTKPFPQDYHSSQSLESTFVSFGKLSMLSTGEEGLEPTCSDGSTRF